MKKASQDIFEPEMPVVPSDWVVLPFEQAADVISDKGKRVKQGSYLLAGKVPVIDQGQDPVGGYTDDEDMAFDDELPVILFGDHTRSFKYVDKRFAVGAEGVKILRSRKGYVPKFFYYLLCSLQIPSRGYSRHFYFLRKFHLPLAPEEQQKRIVAEIEKQFSRLDEAVANLKRVKASLKRYKASVLKAAVEGKLTEDWRKQHPNVEPASKLLERILFERRAKWSGRGKYKEPAKPDTSSLPSLPEKWMWASVDQLTSHITSGSRDWTRYYGRGSGTFILAQNVRLMRLDLSERQTVDPPKSDAETVRTRVSIGDLLVTIVGAKTGEVCRIPMELVDHFVCQSVALLRPLMAAFAKFMELYLASPENGQAQWRHYIYGQGRPHLSFEQLKMTAIALPSLAEQQEIVAEVERRLSVIEELEAAVQADLTRADRLRQAILQRAFSGRLLSEKGHVGFSDSHMPLLAAESVPPYGVQS